MEFITRALITIDHDSGQTLLENISEFSVEGPNGLQAVKTMNRKGTVRGHRGGPAEITATATVQLALVEEMDLFDLYTKRKRFLLSYEEGPGDGRRFQLVGCKIDNYSSSYNADGEATAELSFVAEELARVPD